MEPEELPIKQLEEIIWRNTDTSSRDGKELVAVIVEEGSYTSTAGCNPIEMKKAAARGAFSVNGKTARLVEMAAMAGVILPWGYEPSAAAKEDMQALLKRAHEPIPTERKARHNGPEHMIATQDFKDGSGYFAVSLYYAKPPSQAIPQ